jgi:hypothetical protein
MALILLATIHTFVGFEQGSTTQLSDQLAVYERTAYAFDTATRQDVTPYLDGQLRLTNDDPTPNDYYRPAGEIYSYCENTTRHPYLCDGQGSSYAGPLGYNSPSCGAPAAVYGCTNKNALNYNAAANVDDNSCLFPIGIVRGCTNKNARNYDPLATVDDGSCAFGPAQPVRYSYPESSCLTLVFNEPLDLFVTEQTYRAQMLLTIDGKRLHSLPLPGQSSDPPAQRWLWEHNAGPDVNPLGTLRLYGRTHKVWVEVVVTGGGPNVTKNVDNLVLVSNDELPTSVVVEAPEQGSFTQTFVLSGHRLALTCRRQEQLTYAVIQPPKDGVWGGRIRASWVRVRLYFGVSKQLRLSTLVALLRESVS